MKNICLIIFSLLLFVFFNCNPDEPSEDAVPPESKKEISGNISYITQSGSGKFSFTVGSSGLIDVDLSKLSVDGEAISASEFLALNPVFSILDKLPDGIKLDTSTGKITISNSANAIGLKEYTILVSVNSSKHKRFSVTVKLNIEIKPIAFSSGLVYAKKEINALTVDTASFSFSSNVPKKIQNKSYFQYSVVTEGGLSNLPNNIELDVTTGDIKIKSGALSSSNEYKIKAILKSLPETKAFEKNYEYLEGKIIIVVKAIPITAGKIVYNNEEPIALIKGYSVKYSPVLTGVLPKNAENSAYSYQFLTGGQYSSIPNGVVISSSTGEITFQDNVANVFGELYGVEASSPSPGIYNGKLQGSFILQVLDPYVGATNIGDTKADVVFSRTPDHDSYTVYTNSGPVTTVANAESGTSDVVVTSSDNYKKLNATLTKYSGTYISVVGSSSKAGVSKKLLGSYSFVSGASLYWDATVPLLANSRKGYWANITSQGAKYDGLIGNDGADYTYDFSKKEFENSSDNKNITFSEVSSARAVFLVGQIDSDSTVLGGHSSEESFATDTASTGLIGSSADGNVKLGKFWINGISKTQSDFERVVDTDTVYGVRTAGGVKVSQTQYKSSASGVWKGKFKKYLVFDNTISSQEVEDISQFLIKDLLGGKSLITGSISYDDKQIVTPIASGGVSLSVDKSTIQPSGARGLSYTYSVVEGTLPSGISLNTGTGAITISDSFTSQFKGSYAIKAEINNNANYAGSLTGDLSLNIFDAYVGATNIGETSAVAVFSRLDGYTTYSIYTNSSIVDTVANAEGGTSAGTETGNANYKAVGGTLVKNGGTYISVVASGTGVAKKLVGSYGFVTGASLYWDASIGLLATSRKGHWLNIASSGADYDGKIGNNGADYSYDFSKKEFENSSDNKNITFKELSSIRAVVLVAQLSNNEAILAGHSSKSDFAGDSSSSKVIGTSASANLRGGKYWLGSSQKTSISDFTRKGGFSVYAIRSIGSLTASQTQDRSVSSGVWKGKFKKYLIFNNSTISSKEVADIGLFFEKELVGGKSLISGSISYPIDKEIIIPLSNNKTYSVDKTSIQPSGARTASYSYSLSEGSFPSGISLSSSTGNIVVSASVSTESLEKTYTVEGVVQGNDYYGAVLGRISFSIYKKYVGATNIGDSGATVVFSKLIEGYDTYKAYLNDGIVETAGSADDGTLAGVAASGKNYIELTGVTLSRYVGTNVSVVATDSSGAKSPVLVGSYGVVTGAKMYWDATIPAIANSRAGYWFNIASSGAEYDGEIGNNGDDYSYSFTDKAFENSDNNKNITFKEITAIKSLFLVAQIDNNEAFLAGHSGSRGWQYFHTDTASKNLVLVAGNIQNDWDTNGEYWIGATKVSQPNFNRVDSETKIYGFRTTGSSGSLKANQTGGNANPGDRVWKGKYKKYLIFDGAGLNGIITEQQAANVSIFLEIQRTGKVPIFGSISYTDYKEFLNPSLLGVKVINVDRSGISPAAAQSETYIYSLDSGSFGSGISLSSSTGAITISLSGNDYVNEEYNIVAEVQGDDYSGVVSGKISIELENSYVGATNIGNSGATVVFSRLDGYNTYKVYLNDEIEETATDADDGQLVATVTANINYNALAGVTLSKYVGTNISVVASETGKNDALVGVYGFVTGAKMYWDATVPVIANARAGYWFNVASSGADYDGRIGNDGDDYSYDFTNKVFKNSANNKNITFTEIDNISALFLVAKLQGDSNFLAGHNTVSHFHSDDFAKIGNLIADDGAAHQSVTNGYFWVGATEKTQDNFRRDTSDFRVYAVKTAWSGMKADQTKDRSSANRVWKGQFQKYLIFDGAIQAGEMTVNQARDISSFLEYQRTGEPAKVSISGSISYADLEYVEDSAQNISSSVDLSSLLPSAARTETYVYSLDSGTFASGISINSSTGKITVDNSVDTKLDVSYNIKATVNSASYSGSLTAPINIKTYEKYVGATNIGDTGADVVFSRVDGYGTYTIYANNGIVKTADEADNGISLGTVSSSANYKQLSSGTLTKYMGTNVSVVATESGKSDVLVGSYGFVTGAKMYWDATVPAIANDRSEHWLNIASSGAQYDGKIANNGADYSYDYADKVFKNNDNSKNINFKEIQNVQLVVLVGKVTSSDAVIAGHSVDSDFNSGSGDVIDGSGSADVAVSTGKFWIGGFEKNRSDFDWDINKDLVYSIRTTSSGMKANQTRDRSSATKVWKGEFQKYLIFDGAGISGAIDESQSAKISKFLEIQRTGKLPISGSISYSSLEKIIPLAADETISVDKSKISPAGAQSATYSYSLDGGSFETGISINSTSGAIIIDSSINKELYKKSYKIRAEAQGNSYNGVVFGDVIITLFNKYVGATNISDTGATVVFGRLDGYNTYTAYLNNEIVKTATKADDGTSAGAVTSGNNNYVELTGVTLSKYVGTNVSVVASETGKADVLVGEYGFVTGARMYWDATIPAIATSRAGYWFNIASSGASYDGAIGNSGADYSYNISDKAFKNQDNDKNISFREIANISAVFLVAQIDNNNTMIAGHDSLLNFHTKDNTPEILRDDNNDLHANVYGGKFWIGGDEKVIADFDRVDGSVAVYGLRTSGIGVRANQTQDRNIAGRVWKGKYQKYLIFGSAGDQGQITISQAGNVSRFLETQRTGKLPVGGSIAYVDQSLFLPLSNDKTISVDKSSISPAAAQSATYSYSLDSGSFASGISVNTSTGSISIDSSVDKEIIASYTIKAEAQGDVYGGEIFGNISIALINRYVGATNISDTGGVVVFSRLDGYDTYTSYLNNGIVKTAGDADDGTSAGAVSSGNNNYVELTGVTLSKYVGTNVSVVASETGKADILIGTYGFVTGAKMYWDATVPLIATSRAGHWLNITSSGADYDGAIGNSGADYSYNISDKAFNNDDNDKNITFTRITAIKAVFLIAQIDNNNTFILADSNMAAIKYPFHSDVGSQNLVHVPNAAVVTTDWTTDAEYWIGANKVVRTDFNRVDGSIRVYGFRTTSSAGALQANQTLGNGGGARAWIGKYQKLIIFDGATGADPITEPEAADVAKFLETQRTGKLPISGSISYADQYLFLPLSNDKTISVDKSSISPVGAQNATYSYSLDSGSFPSGISLNTSTGAISIDSSIDNEIINSSYSIKAEAQDDNYIGTVFGNISITLLDKYVGATNISDTGGVVVFSRLDGYDTYTSYLNDRIVGTAGDADDGTSAGAVTSGNNNYLTLTKTLTKYMGTNVSVVATDSSGAKSPTLVGSYGFVTGAKMYWDATVPIIATNVAGHWFNIASSGASQDGEIGNSGADYSYNSSDKAFENSADNKNISYTEITDITAVFWVAKVDSNSSFIAAHSSTTDLYFHPDDFSNHGDIVASNGAAADNVKNGDFWLGGQERTRATFKRDGSGVRVYTIRTAGPGMKANRTQNRTQAARVWKGKYQKYLIFDGYPSSGANPMTKAQASEISIFLETQRTGKLPISGTISYADQYLFLPLSNDKTISVDKSSISPVGAQNATYSYSLDSGSFPSGISLNTSTGAISIDSSIDNEIINSSYRIKAEVQGDNYGGTVFGNISITLIDRYVGATNISDTGGVVVFSRLDGYDTYTSYLNDRIVRTAGDADDGTSAGAVTSGNNNYLTLTKTLTQYMGTNVSVVATDSSGSKSPTLVGSYGFVTGAKMYWDATVPIIATNVAGHWFNIASSGASQDGEIGNSGADYSYNSSDKAFENSANDKNISYTEITDITAVFWVAEVDSDSSFIAAHTSTTDFYFHPDDFSNHGDIVASNGAAADNVKNGDFWLGGQERTRATFKRDGSGVRVYTIRTAGPGMKANQTQHRDQIARVWKGKYQKYLIFDGYPSSGSNPMTKAQASEISIFLETQRTGKLLISGTISYVDQYLFLPLSNDKTISVDKSSISPVGAQNATYSYSLGSGSFPSGISINASTGVIVIDSSIEQEVISSYSIKAEAQDDNYTGTFFGNISITLLNKYVGATNISDTGGVVVFSRLDGYDTYTSYLNDRVVRTAADADDGTSAGAVTSGNNNYLTLTKTLTKYMGTNVSVVATDSSGSKSPILVGSYGFVTGAKMYWDATVPIIATNVAGHWFNIASSGASQDGEIGNSGADYSYNVADKAFENSANSKNISYTEITDISALFLIAKLVGDNNFLAGHSTVNYFNSDDFSADKGDLIAGNAAPHDNVKNGNFWIGAEEKSRADFERDTSDFRVYGLQTAGPGMKADQTRDRNHNNNKRAWKGKFQKYLVFDGYPSSGANPMTKAQASEISIFLERQRLGGKFPISGSISYADQLFFLPLENDEAISVDKSSILPAGAQNATYSYSLDSGSFAFGISINASTGVIAIDSSINEENILSYRIKAEAQDDDYRGTVYGNISITLLNRYVGATNISDTGGVVVFSRLDGYDTYNSYLNDGIVRTAGDADDGTSAGAVTSGNNNYVTLTKTLTKYMGTNISVVATDSSGSKSPALLGSYGFVTGAKMYWDATVPLIATSMEGEWFNITSGGTNYNGIIGNNGDDYSYNVADKAFENSDNDKNISFTEITAISSIVLVAQIDNNEAFLAGNSAGSDGWKYFHPNLSDENLVNVTTNAVLAEWRVNSEFWIGVNGVSQPDFNRVDGETRVYAARTTSTSGNLRADQTGGNANPGIRVWKGKYQKYLIFDEADGADPISKAEISNVSTFLETERSGKVTIFGSISYGNVREARGSVGEKKIAPNLSSISPAVAQSFSYTYVLSAGNFDAGISLNSSTGEIIIDGDSGGYVNNTYTITASFENDRYKGELSGSIELEIFEPYVAATNISQTGASAVFSEAEGYSHKIYLNEEPPLNASDAKSKGTPAGTVASGGNNYLPLTKTLIKNTGTNISVVAEKSGEPDILIGTYGFVTGAKLYWDATASAIATIESGEWFNITSGGTNYNGIIGNSGADYSYNYSDKAFNNSQNNKNITFTRITEIKAVFLIAQIDNNNTFILADSNMAAVKYPFHSDTGSRGLVSNPINAITTDWTTDAEYWIGKNKVVRTSFNRVAGGIRVYGFRTTSSAGEMQANQTLGNGGGVRAWIGKYQKLIIFDGATGADPITETEAAAIAKFLEGDRIGGYQPEKISYSIPTAEDIEVGITKDISVVVDSGYSYDKYNVALKPGSYDIGGVTIANDGKLSVKSTKVGRGIYTVYATNSLTASWTSIEVELKNHYVVDFSQFVNDSSINDTDGMYVKVDGTTDTGGYNTILGDATKVQRPLIADKAASTAFSFSGNIKFYGYKAGASSFSKPNGNSVSVGGANGALVTVLNDSLFEAGEYFIKAVINVNHASSFNDTGWNITVGDGTAANATHEDGAVFTARGDNSIESVKFKVRDGEAVSFASGGSIPTIHKSIKIIYNGGL